MRKLAAGTIAAAIMTLGATASAQQLGEEGTFALSADHLFGITSFNATLDPDIPGAEEIELKGTSTSLLWGSSTSTGVLGRSIPVPATIPRASFDYFVIENLSLGGSLGIYMASGESEVDGNSEDWDKVTGIALAPRIGYVFGLSDTIWLWLRGGPTYMTVGIDPDEGDDVDVSVLQLDVEAMFAFGLTDSFAIEFGPALGLPVGGSTDYEVGGENYDVDINVMHFGVYAGLVGWL
jgi:hypothetical protein